ncbi:MAG: CPBP family glutamic-type intramembrane protease [Pedobacter sp.]|uniref:CPBP family glutamic-type intramembrane protease n=1 Tax=Pedobacter sp. TaxID=1411316 RepID=UPI00339AB999
MIKTFVMFLWYTKWPWINSDPGKQKEPLLTMAKLTIVCLLVGYLAGSFSQMLIHQKLIPDPGPTILDYNDVSWFHFFMGAVLLAPILEELIFRAQLKRFSGMLLFVSLIFGALLSAIVKTYWALLISPLIFGILFITYRFTLAGSVTRKFRFWKRVFPWHFHLTAVCFALLHLANFEKGIALLPLGLLYTLPQLSIGLMLGFTRMIYGLKYSIILHSLYNLFFVIVLFLQQ